MLGSITNEGLRDGARCWQGPWYSRGALSVDEPTLDTDRRQRLAARIRESIQRRRGRAPAA